MKKYVVPILFFLSLLGMSFGIWGVNGNTVNIAGEYFMGKFFILHFISIVLFIVSLICFITNKKLEAIIVPTGPSYEADKQRADAGIEEYNKDKSRLVLISGEINEKEGKREFIGSQSMKIYKQMRKAGIPRDNFLFESQSHNTQENVIYALKKIKEKNIEEVTIVTDKPHAKRFKMLFDIAKREGVAPENLEVKTYSKGIERSYNPIKSSLASLKDYLSFGKNLERYNETTTKQS